MYSGEKFRDDADAIDYQAPRPRPTTKAFSATGKRGWACRSGKPRRAAIRQRNEYGLIRTRIGRTILPQISSNQ